MIKHNPSGAAHQILVESILHDFKHRFQTIHRGLQRASEGSPNFRLRVIRQLMQDVENSLADIHSHMEVYHRVDEASDVNSIIHEVVKGLVGHFPTDKPISYVESYSDEFQLVIISANEIRDIAFNLLANAVRAISTSSVSIGEIEIVTSVVTKNIPFIQITVRDNGTGIDADVGEQIFEKGYAGFENTMGMGLFITELIVRSYGGAVEYDSRYGKGSIFRVLLPMRRLMVGL
ncbi:MAG: ATP-binding protein [Anaerolineae bacterium]